MKYSMFIGRWQPWHEGHRWLIDQRLDLGKRVLICVREVGINDKNPYDPKEVKKNIEKELKDLIQQKKVVVKIIPDIESINYGRGVGYDVIEHKPPSKIGKISATKIREEILKKGDI
jgi:adenylylsulfate kinase